MTPFPTILRKREAARRVGLSVRQLERLESAGSFPRRIRLGGNSAGWVEADVASWIQARITASTSGARAA